MELQSLHKMVSRSFLTLQVVMVKLFSVSSHHVYALLCNNVLLNEAYLLIICYLSEILIYYTGQQFSPSKTAGVSG